MTASAVAIENSVGIDDNLRYRIGPVAYEIHSIVKTNSLAYPSFSPDGMLIIYVENIRGTSNICTLSLSATQTRTVLVSSEFSIQDPTYSPDGFFILYAECTGLPSADLPYGIWKLTYANSDGSNPITILDDGAANMHPCWITPTQIAFQYWNNGATPSSSFHIALVDLAGNGRKELGEGEYPRLVLI